MIAALFATVGLLVSMGYFMLGALLLPRLDALRERIETGDAKAIPVFRRQHIQGMAANAVQLAAVAASLTRL